MMDFSLQALVSDAACGYLCTCLWELNTRNRHADLLVTDVSEDEAIKYIDRFLMFYIKTADRLQRTSTWLEKLEGGKE